MNSWRYRRDKAVSALQHMPEGDEYIVFCSGKFMLAARNEIVVRSAGRLAEFLTKVMTQIAAEKPHYQPVVDHLTAMIKSSEECVKAMEIADKTNELAAGGGIDA